jgi:hypothetical protein
MGPPKSLRSYTAISFRRVGWAATVWTGGFAHRDFSAKKIEIHPMVKSGLIFRYRHTPVQRTGNLLNAIREFVSRNREINPSNSEFLGRCPGLNAEAPKN